MNPEDQFKENESTCKKLRILLNRIPEDEVRKCLTGSINLKHTATKFSISPEAEGKCARDNQHDLFLKENLNECFAVGSNSESESTGEYCERTIEETTNSLSDLRDTLLSNNTQQKINSDYNVSDKGNEVHQMNVLKNDFSEQAVVVDYIHATKKQTCNPFITTEIETPSTKTKSRNFVKTKKVGSKQLHEEPALKNFKIMCEKLPHDIYQIYSKHISVQNVLKSKNIACNLQNVQHTALSSNCNEWQSSKQTNGIMVTNLEKKYENKKNLNSDVNGELQTNSSHLGKELIDEKATFKNCTKDSGTKYSNKKLNRISPFKKIVKKSKSNGMKNKKVEPFQNRNCSDQIKSAQEMNGISNACSASERTAQEQLNDVIGFLSVEGSDNTYLQNGKDMSLKKSVKPESVNKRFKYCHSMATKNPKNKMELENQVKNTNKKLPSHETGSDFQSTIVVGSNISAKQLPSNSQNFSSDAVKIRDTTDKSENFFNDNQKRKLKRKQKEKLRAKELVEIIKEKKYFKRIGKQTSSRVLCTEILAVGINTSMNLIEKSKSGSSNKKSENSLHCDLPPKKCITKILRKLEKRMKKLETKGCMKQLAKKRTSSKTLRGLHNMSAIEFISLLSHHKKLASYFTKLLHKYHVKKIKWSKNDSLDKTVFRSKLLRNENKSENFLEENLHINRTSKMKNIKKVVSLDKISSKFQNKSLTENGSGKTLTENGSGKTLTENGSGKTSSISQKPAKNVRKIQKEFSTNYSQETIRKIDQIKKVKNKTKSKKDESTRETKIKIDQIKKVKSKTKSKKDKFASLLKSDAKVQQLHSNLEKQSVSVDTGKEDASVKQKLLCSNHKTCIVVLPRLSDSTCNSHNNDKLRDAVSCKQNGSLKSDDKTNSPLASVLQMNNHSRRPNPKKVTFDIEDSENDFHVNDVCAQAIDTAAFNVNNFGIKPVKVVLKPLNTDPKLSFVEERNCTILEKLTSPVASILTSENFSKSEKLQFGEKDDLYSVNEWEEQISPFFSNEPQLSFNGFDSSSERVSVDSSSNKSIVEFFDSTSSNRATEDDVVDACMNKILVTIQKENVENDITISSSCNAKKKRKNTQPKTFLRKYNSLKYQLGFLHKSKVNRIQHALALHHRRAVFKNKAKKRGESQE